MALLMFSSVRVLSRACGRAAGFSRIGPVVTLAPGRRDLTLLVGSQECCLLHALRAGGRSGAQGPEKQSPRHLLSLGNPLHSPGPSPRCGLRTRGPA